MVLERPLGWRKTLFHPIFLDEFSMNSVEFFLYTDFLTLLPKKTMTIYISLCMHTILAILEIKKIFFEFDHN